MCKTICKFEEFENTVNPIYTVCAMSEMIIWTMFAIVDIMRITGVGISKKSKRAKQTANSKSLKTLEILYTLCVPCRKWWFKHHWGSNFEKVKMCKTNCKFEKFENTVNLICTVCAMSEMQIWTMFAIVNMMRITGVVISKNVKMSRTKSNFEKVQNT